MFKSNKSSRWFRSFFLSFVVGTVAITAASPALAYGDYRRSCHFAVEVKPIGPGEGVTYTFRVFKVVHFLIDANDGRREIRQHVTDCVRGHWNDRNETRPYSCTGQGWASSDMSAYPFDNMYQQIRQDICRANKDMRHVPVNIEMSIRGKRGCLEYWDERGHVDPAVHVPVARNFTFNCPFGPSTSPLVRPDVGRRR